MTRIMPEINDLNRPFWDGCREGRLSVQRCGGCSALRYPIAPVCPQCWDETWTWQDLAGTGKVYMFAVFRHAYNEAWRERVPYTVAIVEMDEGVMLIGDVADISPDEVTVGMPVRVDFQPATPEITIPRFVGSAG